MITKSKQSKPPIAILGGTFDPIHFGHLRTAVELYQSLPLQEVRFIPCRQPVHKQKVYCSPQQREAMVHLAIRNEPGLVLDNRELKRKTPSYMYDTLTSLREDYGTQPLALILGLDALAGLFSWHRGEDIMDLAHIIAIERPDFNFPWQGALADFLTPRRETDFDALTQQPAGKLFLQRTTTLNISATKIRQLIQANRSVRYLLPESVIDYIKQNKVYC